MPLLNSLFTVSNAQPFKQGDCARFLVIRNRGVQGPLPPGSTASTKALVDDKDFLFCSAPNPLTAELAFLAEVVGTRVAAAAASTALQELVCRGSVLQQDAFRGAAAQAGVTEEVSAGGDAAVGPGVPEATAVVNSGEEAQRDAICISGAADSVDIVASTGTMGGSGATSGDGLGKPDSSAATPAEGAVAGKGDNVATEDAVMATEADATDKNTDAAAEPDGSTAAAPAAVPNGSPAVGITEAQSTTAGRANTAEPLRAEADRGGVAAPAAPSAAPAAEDIPEEIPDLRAAVSEERIRSASAAGLLGAAVKAKQLAEAEEVRMEQLAITALEALTEKLRLKLKYLQDIDAEMQSAKDRVSGARNTLLQERQALVDQRVALAKQRTELAALQAAAKAAGVAAGPAKPQAQAPAVLPQAHATPSNLVRQAEPVKPQAQAEPVKPQAQAEAMKP
jgi:hypothetical protein